MILDEVYYHDIAEDTDYEYGEELTWDEMSFWERHIRFSGFFDLNGLVLFRVRGGLCRKLGRICRFIAPLLSVLAVPALVTSLVIRIAKGPLDEYILSVWEEILIVLLSMFIHELGHLIAAMGYGYYDPDGVDVGFLHLSLIPIGMYVEAGDEYIEDKDTRNRFVFLLDGSVMNLLLASVCFMICSFDYSIVLSRIAGINFLLGFSNLLPWYGTDGDKIIASLLDLGEMTFVSFVFRCLCSRECRKKMRSSPAGIITGIVFLIVAVSQIVYLGALILLPFWVGMLIRGDESILYKVYIRIYYLFRRILN